MHAGMWIKLNGLMNRPNWHRINLDIADAVKIDLKDYILSDPYREGEHALYIADKAGVWTLEANTIFKASFLKDCLLYTSPSPRDLSTSRMPSSA